MTSEKKHWVVAAVLAVLFAAAVLAGMHREELALVLKNASNICFS